MERIIAGALPDWVDRPITGDGAGDGAGDGYGYGYGAGYGYGYGAGYGDGYGYGAGYGDGDGDGYGDGDGAGYGAGYGDGDGAGYGAGYGYGDGAGDGYGAGYWSSVYLKARSAWPSAQRERLSQIEDSAAAIAFWKSDRHGMPANGGASVEPARPGLVQETNGHFRLCEKGTLHATMNPSKWKGERLWIVALFGEVQASEDKFGAQKREIIGEVLVESGK